MNQKLAKKLKKYAKKDGQAYYNYLINLPLKNRILFAWHIIWKY